MFPECSAAPSWRNATPQKTGRDLSDIVFYYVFAMFKVAVIIQQIYYRYFHGMTKDERFAARRSGRLMRWVERENG